MVSGRDGINSLPLSSSSPSAPSSTICSASSSSSATTTKLLNVLNPPTTSTSHDLTRVQLYHDLLKHKNTNMGTVKDVNLKRDNASGSKVPEFSTDVWSSFSRKSHSGKLVHQSTIRESTFYKEPSLEKPQNDERDRNINLNITKKKLNSTKSIDGSGHQHVREKWPNTDFQPINNVRDSSDSNNQKRPERARSWWKGRLPSKSSTGSQQASSTSTSSISGSIRRTKFWNSLSRTLELPERLKKEDIKPQQKVPRLQIWLSTDTRTPEPPPSVGDSVLNNTRENVPRIQLERPSVINKGFDGARWRALSEGSTPAQQRDGVHSSFSPNINETSSSHKSPVEKQPTWPVCHVLQPRPKLIHQNCLNINPGWSQDSSGKRLELPRQNAVWDESENKENEASKPEDEVHGWRKRGSISTESQCSLNRSNTPNAADFKQPLRAKMSSTSGHTSLGLNLFHGFRDTLHSRSYSDERSEVFEPCEDASFTKAPSFNSVFSLTDPPSTPTLSWASSHASLRSEFPQGSLGDPHLGERSPSFNQDLRVPSQSRHPPCTRSHSAASTSIFSFSDRSQLRLTIPDSSRRPSLLSLRSLSRSPIPYISMDYDYDSDYETLYNMHCELVPESVPKLSFTQKLAFPTLHQNSIDRPKPRDPYTEADNNMNTIAKIITVVILTFVTVFILGGLYKLIH